MLCFAVVIASGQVFVPAAAHADVTAIYRNQMDLGSSTTDQNGESFTVAGLSGITYLGPSPDAPGKHRYLAVMDNSDKLVTLDVGFTANGSLSSADIVAGHTLELARDFEGIAYHALRNSVLLSEEGTPQVHEFSLVSMGEVGSQVLPVVQSLSRPSVFDDRRNNLGFESLALHPNHTELWTANEETLTVDGPRSSATDSSVVRLLRYTMTGPTAGLAAVAQQFVYETEPLHASEGTSYPSGSGLVELLALPDGTLLALERSVASTYLFIEIPSVELRLYELSFDGATDVNGIASLVGASYTAVSKTLRWSNMGLGLGTIGNMEGMTLGPQLDNGNWSLLAVVDNDGGIPNRLVAFELQGVVVPEPASGAALLGMLMLLAGRLRG